MTNYEILLENIQKEDICLCRTNSDRIPAVSMQNENGCVIYFNELSFASASDRFVALAHEKGHCNTGAFYNVNAPVETMDRCEYRAWKRAIKDQLPVCMLKKALLACKTAEGISAYDLADHLSMTVDFVIRAINLYVRTGEIEV